MASTWSTNLKIELLGVGDTNWGTLTNNNFQYAFEESITGYATVTFPSDATYDWAALYTNSNSSQEQRNLVLNVVGTLSATRELIVPTIEKQYIVQNNTTGGQAITVKTSAGTGVTVPNGRRMHVYVNGTNAIQMDDYDVSRTIGTLSLTNALAVAQGGTGTTTSTGTGSVVLSNSPALVTPNLGTPSALTLTNATGLPLATGVTGTLAVANGGTGLTALGTGVATALGQNVTGSGGIVLATSPTLVTPNLGTPSALTLTNATGLPIDAGTTGTLPVARGGTGITSFGIGVATALGQNVTGSGGIVLATSPTLVTPTLGVATATSITLTTLNATNVEVTNLKAKDGTAAATIADSTGKITVSTELAVDNLNLSVNTLSTTNTNGNLTLAPNGTGAVLTDTANGASLFVRNTTASASGSSIISFQNLDGASNYRTVARASGVTDSNGGNGGFLVETAASTVLYKGLFVDKDSNVFFYDTNNTASLKWSAVDKYLGINQPSPTANLDVNGTANISSTTTLSSLTASTALALNSSKNIVSVTNTGTGNNVLATSPTLVTPTLGVATATSVNKVAITAPATSATLTIADGKTLTVSRTLTLTGTDSTTMTFPSTNATIARTDAAQTFTGVQTFSSDLIVRLLTVGRGNGSVLTNTAFGYFGLYNNTTGAHNLAVGNLSLYLNEDGNGNTALGSGTLNGNVSGDFNTAVGYLALSTNATSDNSTAVGYAALRYSTAGSNTAVGSNALSLNTSGQANTALGHSALYSNDTGDLNIAVGNTALYTNNFGSYNIAIGGQALYSNQSGGYNVAIGDEAASNSTGSRNVVVGAGSVVSTAAGNDQIVVGYNLTGKGDDTAFIGGTNGAYNEKNVTTWETTSDARLKKNIVDNNDGLAKIEAIRVRNFEYRTPEEITELPATAGIQKAGTQLGVIAQEMLPECVSETSEGVLSVNTDPLVWYLVNAVKELSAQVKALQAQLK